MLAIGWPYPYRHNQRQGFVLAAIENIWQLSMQGVQSILHERPHQCSHHALSQLFPSAGDSPSQSGTVVRLAAADNGQESQKSRSHSHDAVQLPASGVCMRALSIALGSPRASTPAMTNCSAVWVNLAAQ